MRARRGRWAETGTPTRAGTTPAPDGEKVSDFKYDTFSPLSEPAGLGPCRPSERSEGHSCPVANPARDGLRQSSLRSGARRANRFIRKAGRQRVHACRIATRWFHKAAATAIMTDSMVALPVPSRRKTVNPVRSGRKQR